VNSPIFSINTQIVEIDISTLTSYDRNTFLNSTVKYLNYLIVAVSVIHQRSLVQSVDGIDLTRVFSGKLISLLTSFEEDFE